MLDAKNSEHELSIEKFLVKSEEAFFGKVRKDKLSSAASVRSSMRDSVWGAPSVSLYSRPDCMFYNFSFCEISDSICMVAPNTQAFSGADYDDSRHDAGQPEVVPMTRLQIAMSREIGGWPLYTIVIAAGQVCIYSRNILNFDPDHT
jgi:alpha-1,3-glucan synthase